jgi:hypothetical protein
MNSYRQDLLPIPQRLLSLPVQRGYPVPWFAAKVNDGYDFRYADGEKILPAVKKRLCWICGQKLGAYLAFGVGPMSIINRTVPEPPSHKECMTWAIKACPFLAQRQEARRETHLPEDIKEAPGFGSKRQPGVVALWITKHYQPFNAPGGMLFKLGEPTEIHWFREGRTATRLECLDSIESGYPALMELARTDGSTSIQELEKRRIKAMTLLPA